jgi:hypothetical protein
MPSLFKRLTSGTPSKHNNPYSNPHHPSHAHIPGQPLRSASPDIPFRDLLAEARLTANRDPLTGKLLPQPVMPPNQSTVQSRTQPNLTTTSTSNPPPNSTVDQEPTAYAFRAAQTPQTMGTRYDLFSSEERRRMEREEKIRIARGGQEFYAPERRMEEFYAEGVRDW